jgi:hypothetical protein
VKVKFAKKFKAILIQKGQGTRVDFVIEEIKEESSLKNSKEDIKTLKAKGKITKAEVKKPKEDI